MSIKSLLEKLENLDKDSTKSKNKNLMESLSSESSVDKTTESSKTRGLKFWMEQVESNSKEVVVEGKVKEIAMMIDELKSGELDLYDVLSGRFKPSTEAESSFVKMLQRKYDDIAGEMNLHGDDDFEKISDILLRDIDSILSEDEQVTFSPAQTNAQVIKKGANVIGQVNDPQLANVVKQAISTGKMTLAQESIESDKEMISESTSLEHILMTYPHEHKQCQEGWGMDQGFYEALADHYHKEGRIPRKVWHGPLDELRSCVEECYLQDTAKLMGEDISADLGLEPGSFGQMSKSAQDSILTMPSPIQVSPSTSTTSTPTTSTPTSTSTTSTPVTSTNENTDDEQIDEIAPIVGALAGRAVAGAAGAGSIGRAIGSMAGHAIASDLNSDDSESLEEYSLSAKDRHSGFNPNGKERIEPSMDNIPKMKSSGTQSSLSRDEPGMRSSMSSSRPRYMEEAAEDSPVASAISNRIMTGRIDLLKKYDINKVIQAIDDVASNISIGPDDEIGSSDVSGWVRQVERELSGNEIVKEYLTVAPKKGDKVSVEGKPAVMIGQIPTPSGQAKYYAVRFDDRKYSGDTYDQVHANKLFPIDVKEDNFEEGNEFSGALAKAKASGAKEFEVDGKKYPVKEGKKSKPDYLDLDKDGNKEETMKKAAQDKKKKVSEGYADFFDKKIAYEKIGAMVDGQSDDYTVTFKDGTRKRYVEKNGRRMVSTLSPVERLDDTDDEGQVVKRGRGRPSGSGKSLGARMTSGKSKLMKEEEVAEKWDTETKVSPSEKGKYAGKTKAELTKQYNALKKSGPHKKGSEEYGKMRELSFAIRAKSDWGKVQEESEEMSIANLSSNAKSRDRKNKITRLSPSRMTDVDQSKVPAAIRKARGDAPLDYKKLRESDEQIIAWENALRLKLVEGITVTSTVETPESPETVSVSATEQEAQLLKKLLQSAGLDDGSSESKDTGVVVQGGEESGDTYDGTGSPAVTVKSTDLTDAPDNATEQSDELEFSYGDNEKIHREVPVMAMPLGMAMSRNPEVDVEAEPIEPSTPEDVIDDLSKNADEKSSEPSDSEHGTLLSLIKKMIGHGADVANVQETEKVEERKHDSDCECDQCAEKDGEKVTKDIEYDEKDEDDIHGEKREDEDEKAEQAGKKVTKDVEYDKKVDEAVEMCNECGGEMYQGHECSSQSRDYRDERLNEWANSQGGKNDDEEFTTEMEYMTKLISGGLNNMKQDQTTLPSARVKTADEVKNPELSIAAQLRRLSGIN